MQKPGAPMSRETKGDQKGEPREPLWHCAFAPALEHSYESNEKQPDCGGGKNLYHDPIPLSEGNRIHIAARSQLAQ
jgi:hypothetical protein